MTRVALAGSNELRSHLPLNETNYLRFTIEAQEDSRAYFMYSVLDSVYEVGVAMMRWEELLGDGVDTSDTTIEDRLIGEALKAEASMWTRRLIEILTSLICFSATNEERYYRHWLLLDQLEALTRKHSDEHEYFDCDQKGLLHWIDRTAADVKTIEPSLDFARCWYLRDKHVLPATRRFRFSSFAANLRTAMPLAKPREKAELGLSYRQFSQASGSIHFSPGDKWYERSRKRLSKHFSHCGLLVHSVLVRVIELNSMKPTGLCKRMLDVYNQNAYGDELSRRMTAGRAKLGDFVVVGRGLARVIAVKSSRFGYESYTIKYLADSPSPDVSEDDVLPYNVRRLQDAEKLKTKVVELMKKLAPDSQVTDAVRRQHAEEAADEAVREVWNAGLRDALFNTDDERSNQSQPANEEP